MEQTYLQSALRNHSLVPFEPVDSAYTFEVKTPANLFTSVIAGLSSSNFASLTARDSFHSLVAADLIEFARSSYGSFGPKNTCQIFEGFRSSACLFDSMLVVMPSAHSLYSAESSDLHSRVLEIVPCFRCEFTGCESRDELQLIRRSYVSALDWNRSPSPRIWLRFANSTTGIRSTGHKLALAKKEQLLVQLNQLESSKGSWIEIENFLGERIQIKSRNRDYLVGLPDSETPLTLLPTEIDKWIDSYLVKGFSKLPNSEETSLSVPAAEPKLTLFLTDYNRDRTITLDSKVTVSLSKALDEFDRLSDTDGCFIGFKRDDEAVLQFVWNSDDTLDADVPVAHQKGSFQRRGNFEELRPLISDFAYGQPLQQLRGFHFEQHSRSN